VMSKLEDLGEDGFLERLSDWLKVKNPSVRVGIGDDALVLDAGIAVTSDSYEEEIHFSKLYFTADDIGYKVVGATLSDLAAMGAEPVCLLVNLVAPSYLELEFLRELYGGMEAAAGEVGCEIAGGDMVASEKLILCCAALGKVRKPLLRSGALPGDLLYCSGFPGLSAVGRRVLSGRTRIDGFEQAKRRQLRPEPRVRLGQALCGKASACMDVSDGLSTDAGRLARASAVKLIVEHERLPRHPEVVGFAERYGESWDSLVLNGGEDYELLFTADASTELPSEIASMPIHRIGRIEEGEGAFLEIQGERKPLLPKGWDHFRA